MTLISDTISVTTAIDRISEKDCGFRYLIRIVSIPRWTKYIPNEYLPNDAKSFALASGTFKDTANTKNPSAGVVIS